MKTTKKKKKRTTEVSLVVSPLSLFFQMLETNLFATVHKLGKIFYLGMQLLTQN